MAGARAACAAFDETVVFLGHFKDLKETQGRRRDDDFLANRITQAQL